jgi:GEVED domain/Secretion system C-terminal sorting domain
MNLYIGTPSSGVVIQTASDSNNAWGVYSGIYTVPAGQYVTRFSFQSVSSVGGASIGNFLDDIIFNTNLDFGDLPSPFASFAASNGPIHNIVSGLSLGSAVSCEGNSVPNSTASADINDDGITSFPRYGGGASYTIAASATNTTGTTAYIVGYIDWNADGDFNDAGEKSVATTVNSSGTYNIVFNGVLRRIYTAAVYARFRISYDLTAINQPIGYTSSGEVEDYYLAPFTLPVELTDFTANPTQDCGVQLDWVTATESNNDFFSLEKSSDGVHWVKLAQIKGNGNSTQTQHYTYIDRGLVNGTYYYHLTQTDFDGKINDLPIRTAKVDCEAHLGISVAPNPASSTLQLTLEGLNVSSVELMFIDMCGRMISKQEHNATDVIDISDLPMGNYTLIVQAADFRKYLKLVIVH